MDPDSTRLCATSRAISSTSEEIRNRWRESTTMNVTAIQAANATAA